MRSLIVGGGGLGAVVAAYLSRSGHEVTLFVRPAHARAFAAPRIEVSGIATFSAPVQVACDAASLGAFDYLIVCVKGPDTEAALAPLSALAAESVLSLQNGVVKNDVLAGVYGKERVLGAVALVSGQLQRPGVVLNTAANGLFVGELTGERSPRCERLAVAFQEAGIPSQCVPDIGIREWDKLRLYLAMAMVSAPTRLDTATMVADPDLAALCDRVADETEAVAAAEGCPLSVSAGGYANVLRDYVAPVSAKGGKHYVSMTQDLMAGRPTELEWTAGDVLARATLHGIPVPAIETCTQLLRGIERSATPSI